MTTLKEFMREIECEAQEDGPEAIAELEKFRNYYQKESDKIRGCQDDQPCLMDAFFRDQQKLHPSQRATGALISCPCRRCKPGIL